MAARSTPASCAAFTTVNSHRTSDNRVPNWNHVNEEVSELCRNLVNDLEQDALSPSEASGVFERELQRTLTKYRITKNRNGQKGHRPRPIEIATTNARNLKNRSRHLLSSNPQAYLQMVRAHNKVAVAERRWKLEHSTIKQERAFWKNRWSFARSVTNGNQTNVKPSFSPNEAFAYFSDFFAKPANGTYKFLPHWVREVMPVSRGEPEFDTSPISVEQIWRTLKKSNKSSAPGDDSISYHHL